MSPKACIALLSLLVVATAAAQEYERDLPLDHPAIGYWAGEPDDPVAQLIRDVEAERKTLASSGGTLTYLPALLEALAVPADSQTLVFAKNSLQKPAISPRTPRAIYFNDAVSIGFVPGGDVIELAGIDPVRGAAFYTFREDDPGRPTFERPRICLACHRAAATLGVPGIYVSSVSSTPSGRTQFRLGSIVTDHRTPFAERWGGWFVDGVPDTLDHRGNVVSHGPSDARSSMPSLSALERLLRLPRPSDYPESGSDVVALMVLEHQTQLTNLILRTGWEARIAAHAGLSFETREQRVAELSRMLLFTDEAPFPAGIERTSRFAESFAERGPKDPSGRSLRELDLERRLFRYPLSYLITSSVFEALPAAVRERTLRVVYDALEDPASELVSENLTQRERRQIVAIVAATLKNLPAFWK